MATRQIDFLRVFVNLPVGERASYMRERREEARFDFTLTYSEDPVSPYQNYMRLVEEAEREIEQDTQLAATQLKSVLLDLVPNKDPDANKHWWVRY